MRIALGIGSTVVNEYVTLLRQDTQIERDLDLMLTMILDELATMHCAPDVSRRQRDTLAIHLRQLANERALSRDADKMA